MVKKEYRTPIIKFSFIRPNTLLAGSTGATGGDVPWGAKQQNNTDFDDIDESK